MHLKDATERSDVCIAALCGLPGAGKTTLCRALLQTAKHGIQIKHISFDGFLRDHSSNFTKWDDEAAASWKVSGIAPLDELCWSRPPFAIPLALPLSRFESVPQGV